MRFEDLVRKAGEAARDEGRRASRPGLEQLRAQGLRRTVRHSVLAGLTSVALLLALGLLIGSGVDIPPVASNVTAPESTTTTALASPFPTYIDGDNTWIGGECPGADQVLRGNPDGLPNLGQTDEERVRELVAESGLALEDEFGALYYRVVPRGGQVWVERDDGSIQVVDIADYQIELVLPDSGSCPSAPHYWNGIPVVFTIQGPEGEWLLKSLTHGAVDIAIESEQWIRLDGGVITGFLGCNWVDGGYAYDGTTIRLQDTYSTLVACSPSLEDAVMTLLRASELRVVIDRGEMIWQVDSTTAAFQVRSPEPG